MTPHKNYYQVMGVASSASAQEISRAFKKMALKWHPDRHGEMQKSFAHRKFIDLMEAYEVLSNPDRRSRYDRYRSHRNRVRKTGSQTVRQAPRGFTRTTAAGRPKTGAFFDVSKKFEKELLRWRIKAGHHARRLARNSYLQFAVSLDFLSKLARQGIVSTVDLVAGKSQHKRAVTEYRKRLAADPNDAAACSGIGFILHQAGEYQDAARYYLRAVQLNPADADLFCSLGRLREEQGLFERAAACYQRAVEINPGLHIVYACLGTLYLRLARYTEAKICLDILESAGRKDLAGHIEQFFLQASAPYSAK